MIYVIENWKSTEWVVEAPKNCKEDISQLLKEFSKIKHPGKNPNAWETDKKKQDAWYKKHCERESYLLVEGGRRIRVWYLVEKYMDVQ